MDYGDLQYMYWDCVYLFAITTLHSIANRSK